MRLGLVVFLAVATAIALMFFLDVSGISAWAIEQQRDFQNQMARGIHALKSGHVGAYATLLGGAAAYGFVHALGPGHGKYVVGGVGLGSETSTSRLLGLAVTSSLFQAFWAIVLVYGGFYLIEASAHQLTGLAEEFLSTLSYLAIALVGLVLVWRGFRALNSVVPEIAHQHTHVNSGGSAHGHFPTSGHQHGDG